MSEENAKIRKILKNPNKTQKSPLTGGFFKRCFWWFFGLVFLMPTLIFDYIKQ